MNWQSSLFRRRWSAAPFVLSAAVFLVCLFFTYYPASRNLATGLTLDIDSEVIDITGCTADLAACNFNAGKLQIGDQLTKIGDLTKEQFDADRSLALFGEFGPGDVVPITIERAGEELSVDWEMLHPNFVSRALLLVVPLFIFGPFWLVGTLFLFFLQPHDASWRLQVLFYYLTALWISAGLQSATGYAYTSLILHALSWLLIPVFVYFHVIIPAPIFQRSQHQIIPILFTVTALLAFLELSQALPSSAYLYGIIIAFLCSIAILASRSASTTQSAERLSARIMFAGVVLALGPGVLLWIMPTLLGTEKPGYFATVMAMLALPLLPLFYGYAVYKRRLGFHERRVNKFLAKYALFISYLIIFAFAILLATSQSDLAGRTVDYILIFLLAFLLAALPLHEFADATMSRLAYGGYYKQDEFVNKFSGQIPAVLNQNELVRLLVEDICPILQIRQSALLSLDSGRVALIYKHGVFLDPSLTSKGEFDKILEVSSVYINQGSLPNELIQSDYGWLQLAIPLMGRTELIGLWLFGNREPDDYYSQNVIEILTILARQLAITLENGQLFSALQQQLIERRDAEERAVRFADRLSLLHNLDQSLLTAETPGDIAQAALVGLAQIVQCVRASVINIGPDIPEVSVLATYDTRSRFSKSNTPNLQLERDIGQDLARGELWVLEDVANLDPQKPLGQYLHAEGLVTVLSAPLRFGGKLLGSLNIAYDQPTEISHEHKDIAREVASSLVLAIQNARLRDTITQHSHDLKQLSARLITAQETERKRISYELHDEIGQILTAVMFDLAAIENDVKRLGISSVEDKLADAKVLVEQLMGQVRSMSLELRPAMLQELGLAPTLRWYVNTYANRRDMVVHFESSKFSGRIAEEIEIALYRIFQEALTNVSRHANASSITLFLEENGNKITASIEDDGIGFDVQEVLRKDSPTLGVGLLAMRERVTSLNGRFDLHSCHGDGTRIHVEIPFGEKL